MVVLLDVSGINVIWWKSQILLPNDEKLTVLMKILTNQKALLMSFVLGMIAKVTQTLNFSIIPETSNIISTPHCNY